MKYLLKLNNIIVKIEQVVLACSIIAMAVILILNVLGRFLLHKGISSAEELGQDLIIFVTFIGLSYCATTGKHINMLAIFDLLPEKMRKADAFLISGVTAVTMGILTAIGFQYVGIMYQIGKVSINLHIPMYLIVLVVSVGFLFACLQYVLIFIQNIVHKEVYIGLTEAYRVPAKEGE